MSESIEVIEFYLESHLRTSSYFKVTLVMVSFRHSSSCVKRKSRNPTATYILDHDTFHIQIYGGYCQNKFC